VQKFYNTLSMSDHFPKIVPLPEVPDYTDQIRFRNLGIPATMDQECLGVHLRWLETARRAGGLGSLVITGSNERTGLKPYNVDESGRAALTGALQLDSDPSATGHARIGGLLADFDVIFDERISSTIKLQLDKRDQLARESQDPAQTAVNPKFHAKFLNRGIKRGLAEASIKANASLPRLVTATLLYSALTDLEAQSGLGLASSLAIDLAVRPLLLGLTVLSTHRLVEKKMREMYGEDDQQSLLENLASMRQSFFIGIQLDRLCMGIGTAAAGTFVTAQSKRTGF
jgi:hypothetical protein